MLLQKRKDRRTVEQKGHNSHLGQYMKNLGIHQSSPVSVLSDAENLSADLMESNEVDFKKNSAVLS